MEAAVASGILKIVGNKLGPLLLKEYSSIVGAKKDLQELHYQVVEINNWLESVGGKAAWNDPSFNWLKELKDIADEVDDIVDEFQLKAEKHEATVGGGIVSKYLCTKPKSIIFQCKAASKIKEIKKKFAAIVKQRKDVSTITNSLPARHHVPHTNKTVGVMPLLPNIDAASIVGRDKHKHELISKFIEVKDQQIINIVSIIGLGGSGKTTMAKLVFNDGNIMDRHFEVKLWVHVSQDFDVAKLVGKLFESIAGEKSEQYPLQEMSKRISEKLTGKRYLLVLDDVWTEDQILWDQFMVHLKSGTPGSAILLTMRSSNVAGIVRSTYQFSLPVLSLGDSWQLFEQSLGMPVKESEFLEVGKEIVNKCGGVPIAIKVIAGILSGKKLIGEWLAMRDNNLLQVQGEEASVSVSACLMLSYFHLPSHMKQCFTICSVFPKGYMIDKQQLIDQWIAHDMIIPEAGVECSEYIGHKYFNYLVQMSFLQDVTEDWHSRRLKCRMHDLVHDLALSIVGDEISFDMANEATRTTKSYRYFSMIKGGKNLTLNNIFSKARVVYMPGSREYTNFIALKHAKHLRSVMVGHLDAKEANTISQVKYLKYLAMSCQTFPEGITDVWSLQALHLKQIMELPKSIGKLKKLRTLNLSDCAKLKSLPDSVGDCHMISSIDLCNCSKLTVLPDSVGKLKKLRTLNLSWCGELKCLPDSIGDCETISSIDLHYCRELTGLPNSIGRNKMLRVLRLGSTKVERLPSSITKLKNLECLDLEDCRELIELSEGIGNLDKLEVLNLKGCVNLGGMPLGIGQLTQLQKLGLFVVGKEEKSAGISELTNVSKIGEELTIGGISHVLDPKDPHIACLKQKTNLQRLNLNWMVNKMEEVNTELQQYVLDGLEPPPGIKSLNIRGYSGRQCAGWMQSQVGGGVQGPAPFPFLRVMRLCDFPNLMHLDGLVELACLEELVLIRMLSLERISGGPFPSLVKLEIDDLPCLGEVWIVAEGTKPDGKDGGGCCNFTPQLGQVIVVGNCLTEVAISDCPKLVVKPHLPTSLQYLELSNSELLLQSPGQCQGSSSSTSYSHLKKLKLQDMTGLGSRHGLELLQHMMALESLEIIKFAGVQTELPESLWSLTSLRSLKVDDCSSIRVLPESVGELRSLQELTIRSCGSMSMLPQSMGHLTSLQTLVIDSCGALQQLPDCLGELCSLCKLQIIYLPELTCLPESICRLTTSLQELEIYHCSGIKSWPQGMEGLVSLEKLSIWRCTGLTSLPQGMKGLVSLGSLVITNCPGIQSLPEGIKGLTALKQLRISGCPDLQRRCERETGEDWHLISHIPRLLIR